jgi:hypothetical protein
MPTCPACHKESRKPERRHDLSYIVLRAVGIGYFRCAHCDRFYFGFPWYGWQWFIALKSAREAAPVARPCPNCGESKTRRSHRQGVVEWIISVFLIRPYRCMTCGRRFFALKR